MNLANKITCVRIALVPVYLILMLLGNCDSNWYTNSALIVFIIACITDFIDGTIARKYRQVTDLGMFLDPLADKLLVLSAMVVFCKWNIFPAWALMIVLAREFAVSGLRMVASGKGKVIAAGISGKVKTASTMVGLCAQMIFVDVLWVAPVVTTVIVSTTLYSGVEYFVKNRKFLQQNPR